MVAIQVPLFDGIVSVDLDKLSKHRCPTTPTLGRVEQAVMKLTKDVASTFINRVVPVEDLGTKGTLEMGFVPFATKRRDKRAAQRSSAFGTKKIQSFKVIRLAKWSYGAVGKPVREEFVGDNDTTVLFPGASTDST